MLWSYLDVAKTVMFTKMFKNYCRYSYRIDRKIYDNNISHLICFDLVQYISPITWWQAFGLYILFYIYTVHVKADMQFSIIKIQTVFQWQVSRKSNELSTVNVQINNKQILQNAMRFMYILCESSTIILTK